MALSAFTAQRGVSTTSQGHVADHNEITAQIQEILDELLLYRTGRRNVIRNGDMGVAQRGNGTWNGNIPAVYGIDGWADEKSGNGTYTTSRVAVAVGTAATNAAWAHRGVVAGASAAADYSFTSARIEDVRTLAGKEVTLSFVAAATTGAPKIGIEVEQRFGTGGSPSATVRTAVQAVTISTTLTRYTVTFTIPSISGKTLGTDGNHYLQVNFWMSAGSNEAARASSIGIQNATIDITDVQLEQGSGSPFERLSQAEQLAWCQRYFQRHTPWKWTGMAYSTTQAVGHSKDLPVAMRVAPSVTVVGSLTLFTVVGASGTAIDPTAITLDAAGDSRVTMSTSVASGYSAGQAAMLSSDNGTSNYIDMTAEL